MNRLVIFGAGGFGREVKAMLGVPVKKIK